FWATTSLLHIPKAKLRRVFTEIRKVVTKGGIGFITMQQGEGERMVSGPLPGTERFYALYNFDEFARVLERERFKVIDRFQDLREYYAHYPGSVVPPRVWLKYYVQRI
ncbi:MAG: hypothetical protein AAB601_00105, partial [Patescibacteria group bacterium]